MVFYLEQDKVTLNFIRKNRQAKITLNIKGQKWGWRIRPKKTEVNYTATVICLKSSLMPFPSTLIQYFNCPQLCLMWSWLFRLSLLFFLLVSSDLCKERGHIAAKCCHLQTGISISFCAFELFSTYIYHLLKISRNTGCGGSTL